MKPRRPHPASAIDAVARRFGMSVREMLNDRTRQWRYVHARECAWWILHEVCELSFNESARWMNRACHSTGVDAVARVRRKVANDDAWHVSPGTAVRCERVLLEVTSRLDYEPKMKVGLAA